MDTVNIIYSIVVMFVLKGYVYSASDSNGTFVLADHACDETNVTVVNNTEVTYEPVSYDEVLENEESIIGLLSDGKSARLSGYGKTASLFVGCFRFRDSGLDENGRLLVTEIKDKIRLASMEPIQPFKQCINSIYNDAIIIPETCVCVPIPVPMTINYTNYLVQVDNKECKARGNQNTLNNPEHIYTMLVIDLGYHNWLREENYFTSCHVLSTYIAYNMEDVYYSHSGLLTGGTLCLSRGFREVSRDNQRECNPMRETNFELAVCAPNTSVGNDIHKCTFKYIELLKYWMSLTSSGIYTHMGTSEQYVYNVFMEDFVPFVVTYGTQKTLKCVLLLRKYDRLFVDSERCNTQMKYICRKILNEKEQLIIDTPPNINNASTKNNSKDHTLHITLTTVNVIVFVLLVAALVRVIIVKRRAHQNTHSHNSETMDSNNDIELHSIGSSHDGSATESIPGGSAMPSPMGTQGNVTGPIPGSSAMPGPMGTHGNATTSIPGGSAMPGPVAAQASVTGSSAGGWTLPGPTVTVTPPTTCDEVPGRVPGGYNCHYF